MLCAHKEFFFVLCEIYTNIYLKDNINAVLGRDLSDKTLCGVGRGGGNTIGQLIWQLVVLIPAPSLITTYKYGWNTQTHAL